jgi:hypothetical protein
MIWVWTALSTDQSMIDMLNGAEPRSCPEALILVNGFGIELLIGLGPRWFATAETQAVGCESP